MTNLTIRHELHPERRCGHGMDKQKLFAWEYRCDRWANFQLDSPGDLAASICAFHLGRAVECWAHLNEAEALRDYDQQTTRLRLLGKPCKVCGMRRETHGKGEGSYASHEWTDDEDTAEIFERDRK